MPEFVAGLALARLFHETEVAPRLLSSFPGLLYAAALLGTGSEVLGFDTERSTDHDWGPRVMLFVEPAAVAEVINLFGGDTLPTAVAGHALDRSTAVTVLDLGDWVRGYLGFDPRGGVSTSHWLATPTQKLATIIGGEVFHDDHGDLAAVRKSFEWYPGDVWRHVMASLWQRIAEEQPFVGRAAEVGDELGSAVVAARLARDVMRLALTQSRQYPPYEKWLGSAFARLPDVAAAAFCLRAAVAASDSPARQAALGEALEWLARRHNQLELTPPLDTSPLPFWDRPFLVLGADRFATALRSSIIDPTLRARPLLGAVDQWVDSTAALIRPDLLHDVTAATAK